jgi:hypothetical protein
MAKPAPSTHTTTARTWQARLADGRRIQFSAPVEQLADRLAAEARIERTAIVGFGPTFPFPGWPALHRDLTIKLTGGKVMALADAQAARRAA